MRYIDELFKTYDVSLSPIDSRFLKPDGKRKQYVYSYNLGAASKLTGAYLNKLFTAVKSFFNLYNKPQYVFSLNLHSFEFADKNVYQFLDLIAYNILKEAKFELEIRFNRKSLNATYHSSGFVNTSLYHFIYNQSRKCYIENKNDFILRFETDSGFSRTWFRKLLTRDVINNDKKIHSVITMDVSSFLKNNSIPARTVTNIERVIAELLSNTQHNDGDCMLDIDIVKSVINISFINLFNSRLFDELKIRHKNETLSKNVQKLLNDAYCHHRSFFNENYNEDDFYFISAFQRGITIKLDGGGTGLAHIIGAIADEALDMYSYVLSGYRSIKFAKEIFNKETKEIGFNHTNLFYNDIPDTKYLDICDLYIPGVVFQLMFNNEVLE